MASAALGAGAVICGIVAAPTVAGEAVCAGMGLASVAVGGMALGADTALAMYRDQVPSDDWRAAYAVEMRSFLRWRRIGRV